MAKAYVAGANLPVSIENIWKFTKYKINPTAEIIPHTHHPPLTQSHYIFETLIGFSNYLSALFNIWIPKRPFFSSLFSSNKDTHSLFLSLEFLSLNFITSFLDLQICFFLIVFGIDLQMCFVHIIPLVWLNILKLCSVSADFRMMGELYLNFYFGFWVWLNWICVFYGWIC